MIELITGLPGNGKTLYTIKYVKEWAEREKRPVFYAGITILDEVALPWTAHDADKWHELPPGAIMVIDECQTVFRPRSLGKEPPVYVAKLETHRHLGIDLVLITQHPLLCDASIRRLTGKHKHVIRKYGTEVSNIHEWASVRDNCDKSAGRKDSIKHVWKYDKSIYAMYKSAEIHTVKRSIPKKWYFIMATPFFVALCVYAVYASMFKNMVNPEKVAAAKQESKEGFQPVAYKGQSSDKPNYQDPLEDAKRYVFERTPRIEGLAHTAPQYDSVTRPVTAPVPTSCVASKNRCKCYSQQATIMAVPELLCRSIVERGYFVDFKQPESEKVVQPLQSVPVAAVPVPVEQPKPVAPVSIASLEDGYGLLGKRGEGVRKRVAEHNALTN